MRSFWFSLKLAGLFALLGATVLIGILLLFGRVVGHAVILDLATLRAHQGVELAEQVETALAEQGSLHASGSGPTGDSRRLAPELDTDPIRSILSDARASGLGRVHLLDPATASEIEQRAASRHFRPHSSLPVEVRGRSCLVLSEVGLVTLVPVQIPEREDPVAYLSLRGPAHAPPAHKEFLTGVLEIGAVSLVGIVGLALYLTSPLRRMSRAMDSIAAGELEHRLTVRSRDEVAAMGRSFNLMADRIQCMIQGQKELLAGVSHELRSPLARMKMILELLRTNGAASGGVEDLETEIDEVDDLVEELLVASRLELGSSALELGDHRVEDLVAEAWERIDRETAGPGLRLSTRIAPDAELLRVDRGLVIRLLSNLFTNSVRYAASGCVELEAERAGDRVRIVVSDNGPGVAAANLDRLFEPFFRADPSRSRKTGACGLGLMIVRRAVEAHGGSVCAKHATPDGTGLAISLDLPAATKTLPS